MIKSLIGGFAQIAAKPQVLIAGIIATIVQFAIAYLTIEPLVNLVEKAFILQELPNVGLIELPLQFYRMYFTEVNVLILALLASMIVQLWLGVTIARFANNLRDEKKGISAIVLPTSSIIPATTATRTKSKTIFQNFLTLKFQASAKAS